VIFALAVAGIVVWLGFDGGSYGLDSRATLAVAAWWSILMAVVLGLWPLVRPPRAALLAGGLLTGFAALTLASMAWAESAERAFTEFNRVALYLGIFLVAVLAGTRANAARWSDGIAVGITAIGVVALITRLFPDVLPQGQVPDFLPAAVTRLSYPVEYWNGLAIFAGIAFSLLLRIASTPGALWWRAVVVAAIPALSAMTYLTSSRGGIATALIGTLTFLALTPRRWPAAAAVAVGAVGSAASIAVLVARGELVDTPYTSPEAPGQGRSAALLIALVCLVCGLLFGLGVRYVGRAIRPPLLAGRIAAAIVVIAALAGLAASNPVERFETFRKPPSEVANPATAQEGFVRAHLLSGNGSGRWQFWETAVDQFAGDPVLGQGAGSYEAYWAQHSPISGFFVRDAHSLYLEALGELGIVGLFLIGSVVVLGVVSGFRRLLRTADDERVLVAALLAAFLAYAVGAGIDWMWELTVVSVVGMLLLGLLTGPATEPTPRPRLLRERDSHRPRPRRRFVAGIAAVTVGWLVVCAQAIPFLADIKISDSQAAARRGDGDEALEDALAARNLQPWAASPYLQLALVEEATGDPSEARAAIGEAIERDPRDWRLWLARARIETKAGDIAAARKSFDRAAALNPRSPLFANST
jgi:O-Antigen ligase/Tetratricopeptide repeat